MKSASLAIAALLLLAACSAPTRPSTQAPSTTGASSPSATAGGMLATYRGPDRQQILEAGARTEEELTWYTALSAPAPERIASAFEARYPFLKVKVYRSGDWDQRLREEARARRPIADVLEGSVERLLTLREAGLLQPWYSPFLALYPASVQESAGNGDVYWTVGRETYASFAYNTNALPESAVPKTYRDLVSPALKGKLALHAESTGIHLVGLMLEKEGEAFLRQLGEQNVQLHQVSGRGLTDLVVNGEAPGAFTVFQNQAATSAKQGAPIQWVPLEPVFATAGGPALPSTSAHPHAALLFLDFLLDPDGAQALLADLDYGSPLRNPGFALWYPSAGITAAQYEERYTRWERLMRQTFRAGG